MPRRPPSSERHHAVVLTVLSALILVGVAGCQAALGGLAGVGATAWTLKGDSDEVLALDKPAKELACDIEAGAPHGAVFQAMLDTYCAHLPGSTLEAAETWVLVIRAARAADHAGP